MGGDDGEENLKLISKCQVEKLRKLMHSVIDSLCDRSPPRYQDYQDVWDLEQWWNVLDCLRFYSKKTLREALTQEQLKSQLEGLPSDHQQAMVSAIWVRRDELHRCLMEATASISQSRLKDFDWQLKLAMSSDKLASIHQPLVSLDLDVSTDKGDKMVSMEMSKEELQKMITSLEAANKAMLQLKTS